MMQKIVILGGGVSGIAAQKLARKRGFESVIVQDGENAVLPDGDVYVASPGVHPLRSALYQAAQKTGKPLISEMEWGFEAWEKPLLAITGTNGKTTTTEVTVALLRALGVRAEAAGNIGRPLSDLAAEPGDAEIAVVEVSSFQLELVTTFAPLAAVILNLQSDHVDRYAGGFAEYCAVKKRIFDRVAQENRIWGLSAAEGADAVRRATAKGSEIFIDGRLLCNLSTSDLPGPHNAENLCAALELILCVVPAEKLFVPAVLTAIHDFRRDAHRIQFVGKYNGVTVIDDSKGTNPASVAAAIRSMPGKVVLLLGGLAKEADFTPLLSLCSQIRKAVCYGRDRGMIEKLLNGSVECIDCGNDFKVAVRTACEAAQEGDAVLLSPGCASMDMFKNYAERGEIFQRLAREYFENGGIR